MCKFFCGVYISAPLKRLSGLILVLVAYICSIIFEFSFLNFLQVLENIEGGCPFVSFLEHHF